MDPLVWKRLDGNEALLKRWVAEGYAVAKDRLSSKKK